MSWLLDTNVISELSRDRPNEGVVAWLADSEERDLHLSVAVLAELRSGIARMPDGRRRRLHEAWVTEAVIPRFADRIVAVDTPIGLLWGDCHARLSAAGLSNIVMDALIGATALARGLTLVTRNTRDFEPLGISVLNPWSG